MVLMVLERESTNGAIPVMGLGERFDLAPGRRRLFIVAETNGWRRATD
jgi:hypothetical protein